MDKEEYTLRRKLLNLEHRYKMEEIETRFQRELEVQRIKCAEIRKSMERKRFNY